MTVCCLYDSDRPGFRKRRFLPFDRQTRIRTKITRADDGSEADANSEWWPSLSQDGRYTAFSSWASNLVPGYIKNLCGFSSGFCMDVYVYDRDTGEVEPISKSSNGAQGNYFSELASISPNGRYVVFRSRANNLVSGDSNNFMDIFVHDRETGNTERVSVVSGGGQSNAQSNGPSISSNGRYVAFVSGRPIWQPAIPTQNKTSLSMIVLPI